jgi:hypothetical protein
MQDLEIKQNEWKKYFDDFSKRNQSRFVSVEILGETGAQKEVRKMPLSGIVFENRKGSSSFLEIMFEIRDGDGRNASHLTRFIANVQSVLPKRFPDGCDEALEIADASGAKTLLVFEKLPELRAGAFVAVAAAAAAGGRFW